MGVTSQSGARAARMLQPGNAPRSRAPARRIRFWMVVALLVHAELLLVIGLCLYAFAPRDADLARRLAAASDQGASIDVGDDRRRGGARDRRRPGTSGRGAPERGAEKEEESLKPNGQVVDVPAPREEIRPDQARFVSEHDTSVQHETKKYGHFEDNARQGDRSGTAPTSQPAAPRGDGRLAMRTPDLGRALRTARPRRPWRAAGRAPRTARPIRPPVRRRACSRRPAPRRRGGRAAPRAAAWARR